jgi:hypothetical protein
MKMVIVVFEWFYKRNGRVIEKDRLYARKAMK